jgi:HK97 family phage major capsid protein
MEFLDKLRAQLKARLDERAAVASEIEELLAVPAAEERSELNEVETGAFAEKRDRISALDEETAEIRSRITEMESFMEADTEARAEAAQIGAESTDATNTRVTVRSEEMTYRQGGAHSYFRDLALSTAPGIFDAEARGRLQRHAAEVAVETRAVNRTDGAGSGGAGDFVPPLYLMDQFVRAARPGRVTADLCSKFALPAGTDSLNIPKINTGTVVAAQQDNNAATNVDAVTSTVTAPVNTYSGQMVSSLALLEQSPIQFDQVVFSDLIAAHAYALGAAVLTGSGSSGAHEGIFTNTAVNSITYTATSPTSAGIFSAIVQGISSVAKNRYLPPDAIVMSPSRWFAFVGTALDSNSRPLVVPNANGPYNAEGIKTDTLAEGSVGSLAGVPVYIDPSCSANASSQDRIIVARFSDLALFEGPARTRVLFETDANTLGVRFQIYNYSAFTSRRYSTAVSVVSGSGFASVSGY